MNRTRAICYKTQLVLVKTHKCKRFQFQPQPPPLQKNRIGFAPHYSLPRTTCLFHSSDFFLFCFTNESFCSFLFTRTFRFVLSHTAILRRAVRFDFGLNMNEIAWLKKQIFSKLTLRVGS